MGGDGDGIIRMAILLHVERGGEEEFRRALLGVCETVRTLDPGTLVYHAYEEPGSGRVLLHEHFASEADFLQHVENIGAVAGEMMAHAKVERFEVGGTLSGEAKAMLKAFAGEAGCAFYDSLASI